MEAANEKYLELALSTPLFSGFSRKEAELLIRTIDAEYLVFHKGQTLMEVKEAEANGNLMLVLSGMVQLVRFGLHGERFLIDYSLEGSVIGYIGSISSRYLFSSSFIAGRDTAVLRLPAREQEGLSADLTSRLEKNLLDIISDKYARILQKGDITTRRFVRDKILTYLSYESQLKGRSSFDIPLNRQELADYLSVDRTTLSSEITRLQAEGIFRTKKCHFELLQKISAK
ncbi:MAG: Crp/Fnr family transcriptional regulator [Lachnospiraceae bacterium]|nr:Crp/Fnr family transcriptional regulator [Lachnospiraceae bacterium]